MEFSTIMALTAATGRVRSTPAIPTPTPTTSASTAATSIRATATTGTMVTVSAPLQKNELSKWVENVYVRI